MKYFLLILFVFLMNLNGRSQDRFSILISEFFPDPSPVIGLPAFEFIELHNSTHEPVVLKNWKLSDGTSTAVITSPIVLMPDSNLIVCSSGAYNAYRSFGQTVAVSNFPSLNNDKDQIILYSPDGRVIHAVTYSLQWYRNDLKKEGGWTIEMIDRQRPCSGKENYMASSNAMGGSPGQLNAVDGRNPDILPPMIERAYFADPHTIKLIFNEPLDSAKAGSPFHYWIDGQHPLATSYQWPNSQQVLLEIAGSLLDHHIYTITTENLCDCAGNLLQQTKAVHVAYPGTPKTTDLVFNEVLFNPPQDGFDYVEIYNKSDQTFDLSEIYMASKNVAGNLQNPVPLSNDHHLIFPSEYKVFVENAVWLNSNYKSAGIFNSIEVDAMPSMPDDEGTLVLLDKQGVELEVLHYRDSWHFPLLFSKEGIALERINVAVSSNVANNWNSAALSTGYGTPGEKNSQVRSNPDQNFNGPDPTIFSPNQDGKDDFIRVFQIGEEPGTLGNIVIFDKRGQQIKILQRQQLLAMGSNTFIWNGLDAQNKQLPSGIYIIQTQTITLNGKIKTAQFPVALVME